MNYFMITQNKTFNLLLSLTILLSLSLGNVLGQHSPAELEYLSDLRCLERERQALLKFRDELVDEYGRLSSWGVGKNKRECCKWRGVQCHSRTNHVIQLNLRAPQGPVFFEPSVAPLKGKISSSLLELKHLAYLDLSKNDFGYSNFPDFIGSFEKLQYLNLSRANFIKSIPPSVGNLSGLIYLDFSRNPGLYSDSLDWVSNLVSLRYLDLTEVSLKNASNWLRAISKLPSIKELHIAGCELPDVKPSSLPSTNASAPLTILGLSRNFHISSSTLQWFLNFSKVLTFIDMSRNNITSPISAFAFDNQIFLAYLDLSDNIIAGGIPKSFGNMSNLVHLDLLGNRLTAPLSDHLSGPLEKKLKYMDLSYNMITGSLPDFSRFSYLNRLLLGGNKLNGSIAKGFLYVPNLILLDLSSNNFTGTIPDLIFSPFLQKLYLEENMFNGLRESVGCLSKMEILVLRSNNLEGIVTESHLFNLSSLRFLDLSYNSLLTLNCSSHWIPPFQLSDVTMSHCKIGPRFPQWLQFQTNIQDLDISFSQIVDTIPNWFGKLGSTLTYLNASNNQIYGVLDSPSSSFSHLYLQILDLSKNKIAGQPTFLCPNQEWRAIYLANNLFSGHLPSCLANATSLQYLNLANNHFFGKIPNSFGSLRTLTFLNLRNNSFSGGIPTSLRNCTELELIDLGGNRLTENIPTWIGDNLLWLVVLSLRFNEFHGIIPSSICSLQNIVILDLSSNKISGVIPKCLYNLTAMLSSGSKTLLPIYHSTNVTYVTSLDGEYFIWKGQPVDYVNRMIFVELIDLSNNTLTGDIPTEITKLVALGQLNLSRNNLTGFIPENIGLMKSLDSLDLSRNHLSGGIPTSLSELSFLGFLNLSYNNLLGRIPEHFLKFDESSYMGNSGLCGRPILNKSCPGEDGINHQDSNLELEDDDEFITNGFYICMGFGLVIGFWGIFGTILLNKSARIVYFKLLNIIEGFVYVRVELNKARLRRCFQN